MPLVQFRTACLASSTLSFQGLLSRIPNTARLVSFFDGWPFFIMVPLYWELLVKMVGCPFHQCTETDGQIDPASDHVPDIEDFKSLLDVVTLCNLVILSNALDGRTYQLVQTGSISAEERLSSIYARGKCIDLLNWIDEHYRLYDPKQKNTDRCSWMIAEYFVQQISAIKIHKMEAEKNGICGSDSAQNCTAKQVSNELDMVSAIFPGANKGHTKPSMTTISLAWIGLCYDVESKRTSGSKSSSLIFIGILLSHCT
jgi:hypothetical protein